MSQKPPKTTDGAGSGFCGSVSPRPRPPRQPRQEEGDEEGGEQVDGVVVQDGLPADPPGRGGLVAHHLPDARVEACGRRRRAGGRKRHRTGLRFIFSSVFCTNRSTACGLPGTSPAWSPAGPLHHRTPRWATGGRPGAGR